MATKSFVLFRDADTDRPVWLDLHSVESVSGSVLYSDDACQVVMASGECHDVAGTVDEVMDRIRTVFGVLDQGVVAP